MRGYHELADEGCLAVLGPYITDNALALVPATQERHVPLVSNNGSKPFHSYYGFTIGNGGVSEEGAIMAGWLRANGHNRVAMVTEISPGGNEYSKAFRDSARRNGLDIVGEVFIEQNGARLEEGLTLLRDTVKPDALMDKIMRNVAGTTVCDPFMGTGSTGVAALRTGKQFTGIEHNPKHFATAVERISAAWAEIEAATHQQSAA